MNDKEPQFSEIIAKKWNDFQIENYKEPTRLYIGWATERAFIRWLNIMHMVSIDRLIKEGDIQTYMGMKVYIVNNDPGHLEVAA